MRCFILEIFQSPFITASSGNEIFAPGHKGPQGTKPSADKDFSHTGADAPTPTSRLQTSRTGNKPSVDISLKPPATAGCRRSSDWRTSTDFPTTTGQGSQAVRGHQLGLHLPRPQVVGRICMGAPTQTSRPQRGTRENRPSVDISQEREGPRPQPQASARPEPKETNHKPNHKTKKTNKRRKREQRQNETTETTNTKRKRTKHGDDATKQKQTQRNRNEDNPNRHEETNKTKRRTKPETDKQNQHTKGGPKTPRDTAPNERNEGTTRKEVQRPPSHKRQTQPGKKEERATHVMSCGELQKE